MSKRLLKLCSPSNAFTNQYKKFKCYYITGKASLRLLYLVHALPSLYVGAVSHYVQYNGITTRSLIVLVFNHNAGYKQHLAVSGSPEIGSSINRKAGQKDQESREQEESVVMNRDDQRHLSSISWPWLPFCRHISTSDLGSPRNVSWLETGHFVHKCILQVYKATQTTPYMYNFKLCKL